MTEHGTKTFVRATITPHGIASAMPKQIEFSRNLLGQMGANLEGVQHFQVVLLGERADDWPTEHEVVCESTRNNGAKVRGNGRRLIRHGYHEPHD